MTERTTKITISPEEVANSRAPARPLTLSACNTLGETNWGSLVFLSCIPFFNAWVWWRLTPASVTRQRLARVASVLLGLLSATPLVAATVWLWPSDWIEQAAALSEHSVVQIQQGDLLGTGVVIASHGNRHLVLTNKHVLAQPGSLLVAGRKTPAVTGELVGLARHEGVDLALVAVQVEGLRPLGRIARFESIRVGQPVVAIGHPLGLDYTVTDGIISAKRAGMQLQTSAPINQGNSGGPLINRNAELVGINTWIMDHAISQGLGFAFRADWVLQRDEWTYRQDIHELLDRIPH